MPGDLVTERMVLRPCTEADLRWLTALHGDPAVMRYVDDGRPVPEEVVAAETLPRFLREYANLPAGLGHFAAIRRQDGAPLGWIGLRPPSSIGLENAARFGLERVTRGALEVGYRLFPAAWSQGYATEGTRALMRRAFTQFGAEHVVATTMTVNAASRRVLEKAGLTLAGTLFIEWPEPIEGAERGDVVYAVSRQAWLRSA